MIQAILLAAAIALTPASEANKTPEPLCIVSTVTPAELAETMPKDIRHLAADVVRICRENGVNAEFIAAVMRWERRLDLHNFFGWMTSEGRLKRFDSDLDCLEWVIPRFKRLYLEPTGKYYHGATVDGVSICYNNTDTWREAIRGSMVR